MRSRFTTLLFFVLCSVSCGNDVSQPYAIGGNAVCGDGVCGVGETPITCATDCPCVVGQLGCPCAAGSVCASPWVCNPYDRCIQGATECGNGALDLGEQCEPNLPVGTTCESLGYAGGSIVCSNCQFNFGGCVAHATCGDGTLNTLEVCEGFELRGQTCESLGYNGGTLACTQDCVLDTSSCTLPPTWHQVSAGGSHTCGVKMDGSVACWGYDNSGQSTPPSGGFQVVSAGGVHTCGVKMDGSVACWGYYDVQSTPPSGSFRAVSAGGTHTCGVKMDGSVVCWG